MEKRYEIVNEFTDVYTNERYTTESEPISFTEERVKEINNVEKVIGYPLIREVESSKEDKKENKKSKENKEN